MGGIENTPRGHTTEWPHMKGRRPLAFDRAWAKRRGQPLRPCLGIVRGQATLDQRASRSSPPPPTGHLVQPVHAAEMGVVRRVQGFHHRAKHRDLQKAGARGTGQSSGVGKLGGCGWVAGLRGFVVSRLCDCVGAIVGCVASEVAWSRAHERTRARGVHVGMRACGRAVASCPATRCPGPRD